uniref:Uncharacterized protein n=1 Tax=Physcomitrium patens TaxID=3218 RepID=A0A2K1IW06_PHYPA|nr:hypothetical protein PHYPA_025408 [Physcomitrium patens]
MWKYLVSMSRVGLDMGELNKYLQTPSTSLLIDGILLRSMRSKPQFPTCVTTKRCLQAQQTYTLRSFGKVIHLAERN